MFLTMLDIMILFLRKSQINYNNMSITTNYCNLILYYLYYNNFVLKLKNQ